MAHGVPGALEVGKLGAREAADDRHVARLGVDVVADLDGDALHGLEVVRARHRKARLDDVHAQLGELARDVELLLAREGGAGRLLAIAQGGVKDAHVAGVVDAVGDVVGARGVGERVVG